MKDVWSVLLSNTHIFLENYLTFLNYHYAVYVQFGFLYCIYEIFCCYGKFL